MRANEFTQQLNEIEIYQSGLSDNYVKMWIKYYNDFKSHEVKRGKVDDLTWYTLTDSQYISYFFRDDADNVAAFVLMEHIPGWKAKEESVVWASPAYRGKGLVSELYDAFIKMDGGILLSDNLQSPDAIRMWTGFVKRRQYRVHAVDLRNPQIKGQVYWNDQAHELEFTGKIAAIWAEKETKSDVRLVAYK